MATGCVPRAGEPGGVCSGRGSCLAINDSDLHFACICETGWSSIGDLATDQSVDCGINIIVVRVMWGICLLLQVPLLVLCLLRSWKAKARFDFSKVTIIFTMGIGYATLMIIVAALHVSSDNLARTVGNDIATTVLFIVGSSIFYGMNSKYGELIAALAQKQARMAIGESQSMKDRSFRLLRFAIVVALIGPIASSLVLIGALVGPPSNDQVIGSLHYLLVSIAPVEMITISEVVIAPLRAQVRGLLKMREGLDNTGHLTALRVFDHSIFQMRFNAAVNLIINIMMGSVPVLLRKASYQMPIAWGLIGIGIFGSFRDLGSQGNTSSKKNSSKNSSGKVVEVGTTTVRSGGVSPQNESLVTYSSTVQ